MLGYGAKFLGLGRATPQRAHATTINRSTTTLQKRHRHQDSQRLQDLRDIPEIDDDEPSSITYHKTGPGPRGAGEDDPIFIRKPMVSFPRIRLVRPSPTGSEMLQRETALQREQTMQENWRHWGRFLSRIRHIERPPDDSNDWKRARHVKKVSSAQRNIESSCSKKISSISLNDIKPSYQKVKVPTAPLPGDPPGRWAGLICSYNYGPDDTLYVPGAPPRWTPVKTPIPLGKTLQIPSPWSSETLWQHVGRLLEATHMMQPTFNFSDIDIICTPNALITLHKFCYGRGRLRGYTARVVNRTLFIDLYGPQVKSSKPDDSHPNYGAEFEQACTTPESAYLKNTGHYRWHTYKLAHLRIAVLVQVDAYEYKGSRPTSLSAPKRGQRHIAKLLEGTMVFEHGRPIPSSNLANLECNNKSGGGPAEKLGMVFFSRIGTQIDGYWKNAILNGVHIQRTNIRNFRGHLTKWKRTEELRKLVTLLDELRNVTERSEKKTSIIISRKSGKEMERSIDVYEPEFDTRTMDSKDVLQRYHVSPDFLSEEIVRQFWRRSEHSDISAKVWETMESTIA